MARNGSGTMQPVTNSWNPQINGVNATGPDFNQLYFDLINAITQSISNDGQTPIIGNLQMGNNKLTGLTAGTGSGDSLRWQQLFDQGVETDVASATSTDIGIQNSNFIRITGTTTITGFGTNYRGPRFIRFAAALTLTNSATLVLPGNADIVTAAGDTAVAYPIGNPAAGWIIAAYRVASLPPTPVQPVSKIFPIDATVATNILTASLLPCTFDMRSATITNGSPVSRTVATTITVAVPATATLGTTNAVLAKLALVAIDNAGAVELAIINPSSEFLLDETSLISTVAISTGSNSQNVFYSTTARSNVPYRIVGFVESTQATAGQWATEPSKKQGAGGLSAVPFAAVQAQQSSLASFANLRLSATGLSALTTVTADEVVLENTNGFYRTLRAVSVTPSLAASGANGLDTGVSVASTWYSVWVIWNGVTAAGLLSTSATAPTMPAGYTYKARVGWVRSDATANKFPLGFRQFGRDVRYAIAAATNLTALPNIVTSAAAQATYLAAGIGNFVPSTAAEIALVVSTGVNCVVNIAPNATYAVAAASTVSNPAPFVTSGSYGSGQAAAYGQGFILLESTSIFWAQNASSSGNTFINTYGWKDNL